MTKSSRQKINKERRELYSRTKKGFNRCIQNILSNGRRIHILFERTGMFSRIDHIIGHKTSLSKFKKTKTTSAIFSD